MISTIFYLILLTLQFINTILHILRPLGSRLAVVESLPWNRLANRNTEMLAHVLIHLVYQEKHGEIERQMLVAETGYAIEPLRVAPAKVDRHNITMILHTLGNERLFPRQVTDGSVFLLAAVQAGREHQHVAIALETSLYHAREVAALSAGLVDSDADRLQAREIEQEVVDQITELAVIMLSDDGTETYSVLDRKSVV